jgi:hypothetical protein
MRPPALVALSTSSRSARPAAISRVEARTSAGLPATPIAL